jgi:hypothetical protein
LRIALPTEYSHAKPATDLHGKTATMLSLLILEMLTTHARETDRFRSASLELTTLACGNNRPISPFSICQKIIF